MSNLTSKYSIDLVINDDKTNDSIRKLKAELNNITSAQDMSKSLSATNDLIAKLDQFAKKANDDFGTIIKEYSKSSSKAIDKLMDRYTELKIRQESLTKEQIEQNELLKKSANELEKKLNAEKDDRKKIELAREYYEIGEKIKALGVDQIEKEIRQNQEVRARLKSSAMIAKTAYAISKNEAMQARLKQIQNVSDSRSMKERMKFWTKESKQWRENKKARDEEVKSLKEKIKLLDQEDKKQNNIIKGMKTAGLLVKTVTKTTASTVKNVGKAIYTGTGIVGGAVRMVAGGVNAGVGMIGSGLSAATQAADREVEKEHQANRIKGFEADDAKDILSQLYIRTGNSDYSSIVDAINQVQGTLGRKLSKDELVSATEMEMKYPGLSTAFASQTGTNEGGLVGYNQYVAKLNIIQKETGASSEKIAESVKKFSNMKAIKMAGGAVSDYQAVYLAMQNSGAFDDDEQLDKAFDFFLKKQATSGKSVFEYAGSHDWTSGVSDERSKMQIQKAKENLNFKGLIAMNNKLNTYSQNGIVRSDSENMAMQMRQIEEKKNKLLMTLIPAAIPLVEAFAQMLDGGGAKLIADGLNSLFTLVVPVLLKVLNMLNDYILTPLLKAINAVVEWIGDKSGVDTGAIPQNANGGIAIGPSIVGERAFQPEMILPLDYSRSSRAGNIIQNVAQTFNMSGSETTALSLAQAVKSRDFRRATSQNAFLSARVGSW